MTALTLSPELFDRLQKLATDEQLSLNDLIENVLTQYADLKTVLVGESVSEEEAAAVMEGLAESDLEDAQGIIITQDDVETELMDFIENYQPKPRRAAS